MCESNIGPQPPPLWIVVVVGCSVDSVDSVWHMFGNWKSTNNTHTHRQNWIINGDANQWASTCSRITSFFGRCQWNIDGICCRSVEQAAHQSLDLFSWRYRKQTLDIRVHRNSFQSPEFIVFLERFSVCLFVFFVAASFFYLLTRRCIEWFRIGAHLFETIYVSFTASWSDFSSCPF